MDHELEVSPGLSREDYSQRPEKEEEPWLESELSNTWILGFLGESKAHVFWVLTIGVEEKKK